MDTSKFSLVGGEYECGRYLGSGTYGHVYSGVNIFTGKAVAIKFEPNSLKFRLLEHEASVYEHIAGCSHVPRVHWIGSDHNCDVLVMDLLGPSLEMLFTQSRRSLTVRRVSLFGIGLLHAVEDFHDRGYLHRDLKPANILLSLDLDASPTAVYLVDLGLAQPYILSDGQHVCAARQSASVGTTRFCSARAHKPKQQSRRDDLESLAYVLLYLLGVRLPWTHLKTAREVHAAKLRASPTQLCSGLPQIFADILLYARQLEFAERPDYQRLRTLLERNLDINDDTHQDDAAYGTEHLSADCSLRSTWPEGAPSEGLQAFRPEFVLPPARI